MEVHSTSIKHYERNSATSNVNKHIHDNAIILKPSRLTKNPKEQGNMSCIQTKAYFHRDKTN